jgi:hypothetical protein
LGFFLEKEGGPSLSFEVSMMPDLIKKRGEVTPKRSYDARSHKKEERYGIIESGME